MTITQAAKIITDRMLYIDQLTAGSGIVWTVVVVVHDMDGRKSVITIDASMPAVLAELPTALKMYGWAWM